MREPLDLLSLARVTLDAAPAVTKTSTETAAAMETKVSGLRASIDDQLAKERERRDAELKALPLDQRDQVRRIEEKLWNDRRRELIREAQEKTAAEFEKHLQQLHQQKAKLRSLDALVGESPAHLLTTLGTTGSERSGVLAQNVERAQPGVLAQLARKAIAEGDLELGAAIAGRLSGMDQKARPVSVQDLARALVGERHQNLSTSIRDALDRVEDGLQTAGHWAVGREARPFEKIERGLRQHARETADEAAIAEAMRRNLR